MTRPPDVQLEQLLVSRAGFGLSTATPVQRAICRAADGLPLGELWENPDVQAAFGGARPPEISPQIMMVIAGIRGAKSTMAAAKAVASSQNCRVDHLSPGDEIRIPVLATDKDAAGAAFQQLAGHIMARPALRKLVVREPTADSITLRHPTGREIEVKVTALARAGSTLVGRWLAGAIFDEAPRMNGDESVKSLSESMRAIRGRMLPGAQIWLIGSPHAPFGPVYELDAERFGRPDSDLVAVRAPGPALNPTHWTPEACEDLRRRDPAAYRTDVLALFADPEESLISSVELEAATRSELVLPPTARVHYIAAMDPATRGNAWTLVVLGTYGLGGPAGATPLLRVAVTRQWIGSKSNPLKPGAVLAEIAELVRPYNVPEILTDQYAFDSLRELAEQVGVTLRIVQIDASNRLKMAESVSLQFSLEALEIPPDPVLRTDLLAARKRVTQNGMTLVLPKSGDGRHCDFLPALSLAVANPPELPIEDEPPPKHGEFADTIAALDAENSLTEWEKVGRRVAGF